MATESHQSILRVDEKEVGIRTLQDCLERVEDPSMRPIICGQRCVNRGRRVLTAKRSPAYIVAVVTDNTSLSDLFQLLGRCCNMHRHERVKLLIKKSDFEVIKMLRQFAVRVQEITAARGNPCDGEYRSELLGVLSCARKFSVNATFSFSREAILKTQARGQRKQRVHKTVKRALGEAAAVAVVQAYEEMETTVYAEDVVQVVVRALRDHCGDDVCLEDVTARLRAYLVAIGGIKRGRPAGGAAPAAFPTRPIRRHRVAEPRPAAKFADETEAELPAAPQDQVCTGLRSRVLGMYSPVRYVSRL